MNSNLKLLPAALLVSVLALAGCGGGNGGGEDMDMDDAMPEMTAAEECHAKGPDYALDDDDMCKSFSDVHAEGVEEGEQNAADNTALAKAMADAKALLGVLSSAATPDPSAINPDATADGITAYADAKDDMKGKMAVSVMGEKFSAQYPSSGSNVSADGKNTLSGDLVANTAGVARIKADAFSTSGPKTHEQDLVRQVADTATPYFSTMGSYHGVMGTYECTGTTPCTSAIHQSGNGIVLTGTWTFTPTSAETRVTDSDGVEYGWWAVESNGSVSQAHVFFSTPTGGLAARSAGLPEGHGGTATYKGKALGHYAIHRGESGMNDSGRFSADAELTATFGTAAAGNGIEGTINNFMGADNMSRDWMVELKKLTTTTTGLYTGTDNVVWTIGSDASADGGSWQVRAYGGEATDDPTAVAGGFEAEHGIMNARMLGAFGASKE